MRRRLVIASGVALGLAVVLLGIWIAHARPPLRLVLKYGLPPAGGPTGRTTIAAGIEFLEFAPGYSRVRLCEDPHLQPLDFGTSDQSRLVDQLIERLASWRGQVDPCEE